MPAYSVLLYMLKNRSDICMFPQLIDYIAEIKHEVVPHIPLQRKQLLHDLARYIRICVHRKKECSLTFICTHNSRRSHLCQVWAAVAAHQAGLKPVLTYSGGTEATAFDSRAVGALERAGFHIENPGGANPHYRVSFDEKEPPLLCFSKTFDDPSNPSGNFAAIMTCTEADANCPFVPGAVFRVSLPYQDPKEADGSPRESSVYDERCRQIAGEMFCLVEQV